MRKYQRPILLVVLAVVMLLFAVGSEVCCKPTATATGWPKNFGGIQLAFLNRLPDIFQGIGISSGFLGTAELIVIESLEKSVKEKRKKLQKLLGVDPSKSSIAIVIPKFNSPKFTTHVVERELQIPEVRDANTGIFANKNNPEIADKTLISHGDILGTISLLSLFQEAQWPIKKILFDSPGDDGIFDNIDLASNRDKIKLKDDLKRDVQVLISVGLRSNELTAWLFSHNNSLQNLFDGKSLEDICKTSNYEGLIAKIKLPDKEQKMTVLIIGGIGAPETTEKCKYLSQKLDKLLEQTDNTANGSSTKVQKADIFRIIFSEIGLQVKCD